MVGRLMLACCAWSLVGPDRRRAGSLQPDRAGAEPGDDLHRPLRPARPDRRQPGDAARRAAAHGALQQRLPVQLQPVQHRAGQSAGERAACRRPAAASPTSSIRRSACSSARPRASGRSSRIAPKRSAPGGSRWASRFSDSRSTRSRASICSRVPAVFTHDNAATARRPRGRGHDDQRDRGGRQPVHRLRHVGRHRSLRPVAGGADRRTDLKIVSSARIQRLGTTNR